ncbi:nucleotide exchange factor GrpE [Candidatus Amesbacteria bacterium]|nr:nucleotide exchange factor GrpE [Candidatus Amesbacteria bacterium]
MDDQINNLQDQIIVLTDDWKRALADYQNLVKRFESEKHEVMKFANLNLISKLLPSLDILEMSALHSQDAGVKMAVKQFQDVLLSEQLEAIIPNIGDTFDPNIHDCLETITGEEENTLAEIVAKGYKIGDVILRPAKVKVYKK